MSHIPEISVIMPMYNAERSIRNTVRSVLRQTFKDFELIIVDDRSTDNCLAICEEMKQNDGRIVLLQQPRNMGAAMARNRGLEQAMGKYICFIDADDEYLPFALEYLHGVAEQEQADVVHTPGMYYHFDEKSKFKRARKFTNPPEEVTVMDASLEERIKSFLLCEVWWVCWNKIYRRDFLMKERIHFVPMAYSEDFIFVLECLCKSGVFVRAPKLVYVYGSGNMEASVTRSKGNRSVQRRVDSLVHGMDILNEYMDSMPFFAEHEEYRYRMNDLFIESTFAWGLKAIYPDKLISRESRQALHKALEPYVKGHKWLFEYLLGEYSLKNMQDLRYEEDTKSSQWKYLFSVVMAVYNVEPFLREAIDSLVNQDIGFRENIQLILVDDGSSDNSGKICDEYALRFPKNIVVVHQKNGGAAAARNEGLRYIEGEYVNFLDGDDKLSKNAFSSILSFFRKHENEVDMVSMPLRFFDGKSGDHILNYKYRKGSRVIDLDEEYDAIQLQIGSCCICNKKAQHIHFDTRLKFAEDAKECIKILADKRKLGVISDVAYYYRQRSTGEASAIQTGNRSKAWYIPYISCFSHDTLNNLKELYGMVPKFAQYTVMYDLQWRLRTSMQIVEQVLEKSEKEKFLDLLYRAVEKIDDEIIIKQKNIWDEHRCFLLEKKYHEKIQLLLEGNDLRPSIAGNKFMPLSRCKSYFELLHIKDDVMTLEGYASFLGINQETDIEFYLQFNGKEWISCTINNRRFLDTECMGEYIFPSRTYCGKIFDLSRCNRWKIKLFTKVNGIMVERKDVRIGKLFPVARDFKNGYAMLGKWMVRLEGNSLILTRSTKEEIATQEERLLEELRQSKRPEALEAVTLRTMYHEMKPLLKQEIWLLSDRINKADDSGEALFRYMYEKNMPEKTYFVIRKDSADYARMKEYGEVLEYLSPRHKVMHLLADKIVSTAIDDYVMNPFFGNKKYYRDILSGKSQVFLQHGVIHNDLSGWLNRYNHDLSLFVTTAPREYDFILKGESFYGSDVLKMTGLPRHDWLINHDNKKITIMPTWRKYLTSDVGYALDGLQKYDDKFTSTRYFLFYNQLINNNILLEKAKECGYEIQFMPHPNLIPYIDFFDKNPAVKFCSIESHYQDIFAESSMIVTDYSSIAFDFAYLYKPLIYAQFDKDEFFDMHLSQPGYFEFEHDGFGEVEYDLESTVNRLVEYMENGCRLKDRYKERIDMFFKYHDRENCNRVYEAVCKIDKL